MWRMAGPRLLAPLITNIALQAEAAESMALQVVACRSSQLLEFLLAILYPAGVDSADENVG